MRYYERYIVPSKFKLTYVPPSTSTNLTSAVNKCYMFRPYWSSSGSKYTLFKTREPAISSEKLTRLHTNNFTSSTLKMKAKIFAEALVPTYKGQHT